MIAEGDGEAVGKGVCGGAGEVEVGQGVIARMSDGWGLCSVFVRAGWGLLMVRVVTLGGGGGFDGALERRFSEGGSGDWDSSWAAVNEVDGRLGRGWGVGVRLDDWDASEAILMVRDPDGRYESVEEVPEGLYESVDTRSLILPTVWV